MDNKHTVVEIRTDFNTEDIAYNSLVQVEAEVIVGQKKLVLSPSQSFSYHVSTLDSHIV